MPGEKTAVHNIKNLINNYFGQERESEDVDRINGTFMNLMEVLLKPSDEGKQLFASLVSRENDQNRSNPNSNVYKRIYAHLNEQMSSNKFAFERNNPKQLAAVMLMIKVDRAGKMRDSFGRKSALDVESMKSLTKVANSLDEKGFCDIADDIDRLFGV